MPDRQPSTPIQVDRNVQAKAVLDSIHHGIDTAVPGAAVAFRQTLDNFIGAKPLVGDGEVATIGELFDLSNGGTAANAAVNAASINCMEALHRRVRAIEITTNILDPDLATLEVNCHSYGMRWQPLKVASGKKGYFVAKAAPIPSPAEYILFETSFSLHPSLLPGKGQLFIGGVLSAETNAFDTLGCDMVFPDGLMGQLSCQYKYDTTPGANSVQPLLIFKTHRGQGIPSNEILRAFFMCVASTDDATRAVGERRRNRMDILISPDSSSGLGTKASGFGMELIGSLSTVCYKMLHGAGTGNPVIDRAYNLISDIAKKVVSGVGGNGSGSEIVSNVFGSIVNSRLFSGAVDFGKKIFKDTVTDVLDTAVTFVTDIALDFFGFLLF